MHKISPFPLFSPLLAYSSIYHSFHSHLNLMIWFCLRTSRLCDWITRTIGFTIWFRVTPPALVAQILGVAYSSTTLVNSQWCHQAQCMWKSWLKTLCSWDYHSGYQFKRVLHCWIWKWVYTIKLLICIKIIFKLCW